MILVLPLAFMPAGCTTSPNRQRASPSETAAPISSENVVEQFDLARTLYNQGDYGKAESILRAILTLAAEVGKLDKLDALETKTVLGHALMMQRQYVSAATEYSTAIDGYEQYVGPDLAHALEARSGLVNALRSEGRTNQAMEAARSYLKHAVPILGAEDSSVL